MERNVFPKAGLMTAMSAAKKLFYYTVVVFFFGLGALMLYVLALMVSDEDSFWPLNILFGGVVAFIVWIVFKLLKLPKEKGPTTFKQVETDNGFVIYATNEWTGETEIVPFEWSQVTDLLIGLWTNPGFKERKYDYVGARLLYRYIDSDSLPQYFETIIVNEELLDEWVETITNHKLPARITDRNISAVKKEDFDVLLQTIAAIPFDGTLSIKDWFMEQEDFTLWQPPS